MGSLPNLHELSKDKLQSPVHRPAPIGGLGPVRLPPQPPPLAHTHKRARSSGHHHATLWDNDAMLEVLFPHLWWELKRKFKKDIHIFFLYQILKNNRFRNF